METLKTVVVPDIGDFQDVPVIEVLVKTGDTVQVDDSLVTLESDKATIDIPSPYQGTVKGILIKAGDKVSEGSALLTMEVSNDNKPVIESTTEKPLQPASLPLLLAPMQPASFSPPVLPVVPTIGTDRPHLGDFFGDRHQSGHRPKRLTQKIHIQTSN